MALQPFQHSKPEQAGQSPQPSEPGQHRQVPQSDPDGEGGMAAHSMTPKPFKEPKDFREFKEPKAFKEYRTPQCPPPHISAAFISDNGDGTETWEFTLELQDGFDIADYGANFRFILSGVFTGDSGSASTGADLNVALTDTFQGYSFPSGSTFLMAVLVRNTADGMLDSAIRTTTDLRRRLVLELIGDNAPAGSVAVWSDNSGSGNNASQSATDSRPTRVDAALNGHAIVRFDGSDDAMTITPLEMTAATFVAVITINGDGIDQGGFEIFGTRSNDSYFRYPIAPGTAGYGFPGMFRNARINAYPAGGIPDSGSHIVSVVSTDDHYETFLDGVGFGAQAGDFLAGDSWRLGSSGGDFRRFPGDFAHVCIFGQRDDAQRIAWEDYLAARYGITLAR